MMKKLNILLISNLFFEVDLNKLKQFYLNEIPQAFLSFLISNNGIRYKECITDSGKGISDFLCLNSTNDYYSIIGYAKQNESYLPKVFLPFAIDGGGDPFLISLRDKDYGKIYFFRTDMYIEEVGALLLLYDNFEEFINGLMTEEEAIAKGVL